MPATIDQLLSRTNLLWRSDQRPVVAKSGLSTGHAALDAALRESGWPRGALVELLMAQPGAGEMLLLAPVLAAIGASGLCQIWIDPPFEVFAPGLSLRGIDLARLVIVRPADHNQMLWAFEQAVRSPGCGAVLCWSRAGRARYAQLRKLQVAAAERSCVGFILGHPRHAEAASPAALRLRLSAVPAGLHIEVLKQRGGRIGQCVTLETPGSLRRQPPMRERDALVSASLFPIARSRARLFTPAVEAPTTREQWQ